VSQKNDVTNQQPARHESTTSTSSAPKRTIHAIDLFCGAGGLSTGLALACEDLNRDVELTAVNHWGTAIETHECNHPWARQLSATVEELHPPAVIPGDETTIDLLVAAPECTHFSTARGGKPVTEQQRASPWHVLDWLEKLDVQNIVLENVSEFEQWGPIDEDGTPTRNGEIFEAWVNSLHALGYSVDWRTLNAADYGDPTTRKRLFVVGRKGKRAEFPTPTHSHEGTDPGTDPWRPASEIIDWSDLGTSIWQRSHPLVNNTMQRIAEGIRRHCGDRLEPFADVVGTLGKTEVTQLQNEIVPATDAGATAEDRDSPFLVNGSMPVPVSPERSGRCVPYLLGQHGGSRPRATNAMPVPTIATRGAIGLYQPQTVLLPEDGASQARQSPTTDEPAKDSLATTPSQAPDEHMVSPYLVPYYSERAGQVPRTHEIEQPVPTITATGSDAYLAQPFLVEYYGNGGARSVNDPLPTVTTRDTFALVLPEQFPWGLDIRFRMLHPRELAAAMGFPPAYEIIGNKTDTTKQIGNAVPVNLATALCKQMLIGNEPSLQTFTSSENTPADD
jgi:DNA (cytosine-5)-methyltransferase 1